MLRIVRLERAPGTVHLGTSLVQQKPLLTFVALQPRTTEGQGRVPHPTAGAPCPTAMGQGGGGVCVFSEVWPQKKTRYTRSNCVCVPLANRATAVPQLLCS